MALFQIKRTDGTLDPRVWTTDEGLRKRQVPNPQARDALLKLLNQPEVIIFAQPATKTVDQLAAEIGGPDDVELGDDGTEPTPTPPVDALTAKQQAQTLRLEAAALTKAAELLEAPPGQ